MDAALQVAATQFWGMNGDAYKLENICWTFQVLVLFNPNEIDKTYFGLLFWSRFTSVV